MADPMVIRATANGDVVDVRIRMKHEMESGQRKDANGKLIPAWHIQTVVVKYKDREVMNAQFGPAVSKNPIIAFKFSGGAKGDKISATWIDNKGDKRTDEGTIA